MPKCVDALGPLLEGLIRLSPREQIAEQHLLGSERARRKVHSSGPAVPENPLPSRGSIKGARMHVEGAFEVRRDRQSVYAFFTDAHRLLDCIDDPRTLGVADSTHFSGTVTTDVAFVRGPFRVKGE